MDILEIQIEIQNQIERLKINFKKSAKERLTKQFIESRLQALENKWCEFAKNHYELIKKKSTLNTDYFSKDTFGSLEEFYLEFKTNLNELLDKFTANTQINKSLHINGNSKTSVKLPKITIPMFSGLYTEWISFRDMFISLIHSNNNLDNVQKLHYLKGHLTGEAEQLVRHIPITNDTYEQCWILLDSRYNNKQYLANCILKRFFSQRNVLVESASFIKQLLDNINDLLNGLLNLNVDTQSWDLIVIYIVCQKLDPESRKQWEAKISNSQNNLPTLDSFKEFLEHRFRSLEFLDSKEVKKQNYIRSTNQKMLHVATLSCNYCSDSHKLYNCKKFANLDNDVRREFVRSNALCFNCLGGNHSAFSCRQTTRCRICKKRHHSLLHPNKLPKSEEGNDHGSSDDKDAVIASMSAQNESNNVVSCFSDLKSQVLLATALVKVETKTGTTVILRALLDQGSQASFITESAVQLLGLRKMPTTANILRLGDEGNNLPSKAVVSLKIKSRFDSTFVLNVNAYVLKKLTSFLPEKKIVQMLSTISAVDLADPSFGKPNKIDLVLSAGVYAQILLEGLVKGPPGLPIAQNTKFGWILSGDVHDSSSKDRSEISNNFVVSMHVQLNENEILKKFWELEEPVSVNKKILTEEEQLCEQLFSQTTRRDKSGRYIVRLPFKRDDPLSKYGNSRHIAQKRFYMLEHKLNKNSELKTQYSAVIKEYLDLNHMEVIPTSQRNKSGAVYLPHHAVVRNDKSTTKVRTVFDASCQGINGVSLNDDLMVGPKLQPELRQIIMRWRCHPICLVADIVKMYRQIKVSDEDTDYQRLLWRDNPNSELQHLRLLRVTFGTSAAPYLAVKCLQQLSYDEGNEFPLVSNRVLNDFYVDDLITGCQTVSEGKAIYKDMNELLNRGGFQLQKWCTNSSELMEQISNDIDSNKNLDLKIDSVIKILGITWDHQNDEFQYTCQLPPLSTPVTKRKVVSDISRLYDPLGWIAPVIITAKILIQKLWLSGIDWDEELPSSLLQEWLSYRNNLQGVTEFRIPRWIKTESNNIVELHGFSDASNNAYAAVVYSRVICSNDTIYTHLIASKTKVSPIKQVSIPRLELCGAVLLAKLLNEITTTLGIMKTNVHAWTDSSVVLAWLKSHPSKWKTFVGNRVSEILTIMDNSQWSHVISKENPADCASRGLSPSECNTNDLWKKGPEWLKNKIIIYNQNKIENTNLEERKEKIVCHLTSERIEECVLSRFSSLRKLTRVIAYCKRFLMSLKYKNNVSYYVRLTCEELNKALLTCIKICQKQCFNEDIENLKKDGRVNKKSKLTFLYPYIDANDILRVGGRLQKAEIQEDMKHPVIMPHKSHFTDLLIADAHERTLHGGPQLMLNYLRTKYWIINAKSLVRNFYRKCVTCIRYSAQSNQQLMGQLPTARVTARRPFFQSGVDYAGPISIRPHKGRGYHSSKGYICLFVCMATRAIHLEVVSDLTTQSFIASFKRFTARRGHCADLWSDNGTTFVGANKYLQTLFSKDKSSLAADVASWLANNGTTWHFIPPHSPNFGGLWEAGVKSTKTHLKRIIGTHTLTFEELTTVLTQIEACLNSRPLNQLNNNNPEDSFPLTPAHFLIGEPLLLIPEPCDNTQISNLQRWHLTQRLVQNFWQRWSQEYLTKFHNRYKWSNQTPEPQIGDVVLVKEDNLPPAYWLYGIIVQKHIGPDNLTRVVSLKCKGNIIKRPTSKIIILPIAKD